MATTTYFAELRPDLLCSADRVLDAMLSYHGHDPCPHQAYLLLEQRDRLAIHLVLRPDDRLRARRLLSRVDEAPLYDCAAPYQTAISDVCGEALQWHSILGVPPELHLRARTTLSIVDFLRHYTARAPAPAQVTTD